MPATGRGACPSDQLHVTLFSASGALGSLYSSFEARNIGRSSCEIGGYFGVSVYDPAGKLIGAVDSREPFLSRAPVRSIRLAPGAVASFTVRLEDVTCVRSSPYVGAWHLIPPNDTTYDQVSTRFGPPYCGEPIDVSPNELGPPTG